MSFSTGQEVAFFRLFFSIITPQRGKRKATELPPWPNVLCLCLHGLQRLCQLIGAGGRSAAAANAFNLSDDLVHIHTFYQLADALQVAVAAADEVEVLDLVILDLENDLTGASAAGLVRILHTVMSFLNCIFFLKNIITYDVNMCKGELQEEIMGMIWKNCLEVVMKDDQKIQQQREQIQELGADVTKTEKGNIYTLTIIGQVEGHMIAPENVKTTKYEHILPLLASIEESDEFDGLLLLLNTVGGDIEAGLAIAEMIAGMKKPTVSLVLGGGHSIGIPLAVCTKKSFITPTASMTVHPVRMTGLVVGAPQTFRYFQRIQEQIADFVTANSRISRREFEDYMMATGEIATDVGTILYGKEAVASGLIDRLGGLSDALGALHRMIGKNKK